MTVTEQILASLSRLEKKVDKIARQNVKEDYIDADEVKKRFHRGKATLQKMRREGSLTDYKRTKSGRNFMYSVKELERIFSIKLKLA